LLKGNTRVRQARTTSVTDQDSGGLLDLLPNTLGQNERAEFLAITRTIEPAPRAHSGASLDTAASVLGQLE